MVEHTVSLPVFVLLPGFIIDTISYPVDKLEEGRGDNNPAA